MIGLTWQSVPKLARLSLALCLLPLQPSRCQKIQPQLIVKQLKQLVKRNCWPNHKSDWPRLRVLHLLVEFRMMVSAEAAAHRRSQGVKKAN
jgi:hypothetical protein